MGNCAVRGQGKGLEGAEVGARSACGFCSDLALCSVRAEREESERVRACVRGVCTYDCRCQGVGASLPLGRSPSFLLALERLACVSLLFQVSNVALSFRNSISGFLPYFHFSLVRTPACVCS